MDAIRPFKPEERIDEAIARLARNQHGVFTRAQAAALGATDSHLKHGVGRGRYIRVQRSIFATAGTATTFEQRVMAVCLAGRTTYASHRTAARLWRLAGFDRAPVEVITTVDRRGRPDVTVYRTRELPACDVTRIGAVPVTTPARTIIDLAAIVDEASLEIALDDALRRGLTSMPRLCWRLTELGRKGRAGTASMRRLIAERTAGPAAESALETKVIRALRNAGLPEPMRQYRISEKGQTLARADLAWPAQRVILEVDSYRYHSGRLEWERDLVRRNKLESAGWKVVNVTAQQLAAGNEALVRQLNRLLTTQRTFFGEK